MVWVRLWSGLGYGRVRLGSGLDQGWNDMVVLVDLVVLDDMVVLVDMVILVGMVVLVDNPSQGQDYVIVGVMLGSGLGEGRGQVRVGVR